ncbi:hypothetical protein, partial [Escherichia coli]|uniref:hypothetical protein n=1 Tax=Escherichia coli TaxID=562 RepID=UPI001C9A3D70
ALTFQNHTDCPLTDFGGKTSIFSHPVYLFLRKFSLQDSRGGSDITFWLDLSLSSCVKMKFTYKEGTVKESPLSCLNNVSNIAHNISCKNPQQE